MRVVPSITVYRHLILQRGYPKLNEVTDGTVPAITFKELEYKFEIDEYKSCGHWMRSYRAYKWPRTFRSRIRC